MVEGHQDDACEASMLLSDLVRSLFFQISTAGKDGRQPLHVTEDSSASNADVQALLRKLLDDLSTNQRVQEILQNPEKDDLCFLNVWDFGGQEAFAIVQRVLFANVWSAYAAVFDSALELEVRA